MPPGDELFRKAILAFQRSHTEDPREIVIDGKGVPWSLHYHQRLTHWVKQLHPSPPQALLLAAQCQHLRRWTIPRDRFPEGRNGYRQWRKTLSAFHAEEAGRILPALGYPPRTVKRVQQFLQKYRLKLDPEVQLFEDAICLVFLENELAAFSRKHHQAKLSSILQKTWKKMSPAGHRLALELLGELPEDVQGLVQQAVSDD